MNERISSPDNLPPLYVESVRNVPGPAGPVAPEVEIGLKEQVGPKDPNSPDDLVGSGWSGGSR